MSLGTPSCSFSIPSLHDSTELLCRIYYPKKQSSTETFRNEYAILAHPYASLGGSYDDPVIGSVGSMLLAKGMVLGTFNFR